MPNNSADVPAPIPTRPDMNDARHPKLPQDPRFYETVLDLVPTPVLVVNGDGTVTYGNQALMKLSGWTLDNGLGMQMLDAVHPDDLPSVMQAYQNVANAPTSSTGAGAPWLPIRFRIIARDGRIIPMEATGVSALGDSSVEGIVYHVRTCRDDELLAEVFAGVASHDPVALGCAPLVERLTLPPHAMAVAIFEQHANGTARCVVSSNDVVAQLPATSISPVPWAGLSTEPTRTDLDALPVEVAATLRSAGFGAVFHAGAHSPDFAVTLRLVACTAIDHSVQGPISQISQARELLSLIATKAHNDRTIASNAMRDDLTGLPNRLGLSHRFDRIMATTDDCAVMFIDVDRFKPINDDFGHAAGDHVLATIADRLVRAVRPDDFVSRIGGDEFVVVLTDAEGRLATSTVHHLADRIVAVLSEPVVYEGRTIEVGASVGVALGHHRNLDELIAKADGAMYRAKRAGGDRHHVSIDSAA